MYEFVHLNCHSEYSVLDGILKIKPFIAKVKELGMRSVAITDQSNLFAMIKFYKAAISMGIKPIIGSDVFIGPNQYYKYTRLTLLCQNQIGLHNLMILISRSYNNWHGDKPLINLNWLFEEQLHEGLIAIAPMFESDIGRAICDKDLTLGANLINNWYALLGDRFYLGISRVGKKDEEEQIQQVLDLAGNKIPLVATADVRFLLPEDFMAHEARICINQGVRLDDPQRKKEYTNLQYLKSPQELSNLFADLPSALINTQEIAKRCNVKLDLGKTYLPNYQTPDGSKEPVYLQILAIQGLLKRLNCNSVVELPNNYIDRLNSELHVINNMGFAGYFLIVADIIQWSLKQGIPVGPGRGSGAGSLVAYALFITNINPLEYGLLFERFLNPERISMPDFDIDFCIHGRDLVIDYVANKYGKGSVAQIITYGTMAAKAAIRDVGRVLGNPYGFVDQIAKMIPLELGMTISKALEQEATLKSKYGSEDEVKSMIDLAIKLEGMIRNVGKHAGGLVISPKPIVNFCPLYYEANGAAPVTQFDKNDIEDLGLVKFDFLGLKTLTIIDLALKAVNKNLSTDNKLDLNDLPLDDIDTFKLLADGHTFAVFQLESRGMRELTMKLQPNCFEDLIAIGALYRPGPLQSGMVDDFINRKRGKEAIQYPHPEVADILKPTYGVIVYQEQVMQIAQILAGYTLGAADLLRRAMGKKKPEEMAKQRKIFRSGVEKLDLQRTQELKLGAENAESIFNLIDKFSGYGFNKSHAAAYALITYQTAWLKTHYPAEFMAAVLSLELAHTDKIMLLNIECKDMGIKVLPPNINQGSYYFVAQSANLISYGLGAIKGVGEIAINNIIEARAKGPFVDLLDLCIRVDLHKVSRKTLEALIKAGALDEFKLHRAALLNYLEDTIKIATKSQQSINSVHKQLDLFADLAQDFTPKMQFNNNICLEWDLQEFLIAEKQALGFYLSDHPLSEFKDQLKQLGVINFKQAHLDHNVQKFAGCIMGLRISRTKRGDKMAFVTLNDGSTMQEIVVFADLYQQAKELLKKDQLIIIEGEVSKDSYTGGFKIKCNKIFSLPEENKKLAIKLTIVLNPVITDIKLISDQIKNLITRNPGNCPLMLHYQKSGVLTKIKLGENWSVTPEKKLLASLKNLPEVADAYVDY